MIYAIEELARRQGSKQTHTTAYCIREAHLSCGDWTHSYTIAGSSLEADGELMI